MQTKKEILIKLKELQPNYEKEGIVILGLFGSYARDNQTKFSDIDIVYKLNYEKFSEKYLDGFSKVLRLEAIKDELQTFFNKRIDFVSNSNKTILKDVIYV